MNMKQLDTFLEEGFTRIHVHNWWVEWFVSLHQQADNKYKEEELQ